MNKKLLHISLSKFNKLNKKCTFLITPFAFALYLAFIFSLSLAGRLIYTSFRTIFLTRSQKNVSWIVCVK